MKKKRFDNDIMQLLRLIVSLWLGYLLALMAIDHLLYRHPLFPPMYYLINGINGLIMLGFSRWRWGQTRLGDAFLPLVITLMSLVPITSSNLMVLLRMPGPSSSPEGIAVRLMPMLFIALILTAWQYRWRGVILFTGAIALFTLGMYGLLFWFDRRSFLPPTTVLIIQTVSLLVVGYFISRLINQLKIQQASLAQANAQLVHYSSTLEDLTISRERNRMARELHDTLAHTLSALSVQLETVKAYWDVDAVVAQQMLDKSLVATRSGLQETRRALKSLRASPLDDLGLGLAIHKIAEETAARANLNLDLLLPKQLPTVSLEKEQTIYRIAQEAIANVAHHANARTLTVQLTPSNSSIVLLVKDDGIGFRPEKNHSSNHFGLPGMQERAELVGAKLSINSKQGQGTTIQLIIGNYQPTRYF